MIRFLTAGESHGKALLAILEGVPASLPITLAYINAHLLRRQKGIGRGKRMEIERDEVEILSGVRGGKTLGSPIALLIKNRDWENWKETMDPEKLLTEVKFTRPRPGHADLAGGIKFQHRDLRNVLERASARETAARVAVGAIARRMLEEFGILIFSQTIQIGSVKIESDKTDLSRIEESPLRCADAKAEREMISLIQKAQSNKDTLGGVFEVVAQGVPPGVGSYTHWEKRLDAMLAGAVMSIPGVKGVEIGEGFYCASNYGSSVHDQIYWSKERGYYRETNRAGGIEGGVSNGEDIVVRGAMKPIPTLGKPLMSVDIDSKELTPSQSERADVCVVPSAGVVGEAVVAIVLASAIQEKFGGDTVQELKENLESYLKRVAKY